jgi:hypothetical protein
MFKKAHITNLQGPSKQNIIKTFLIHKKKYDSFIVSMNKIYI